MKRLRKISTPLVATVALLLAGDLGAAPDAPAATPEQPSSKAAVPPAAVNAEQMKQRSAQLVEQQRRDSLRFHHLQAQARKQKDVIKLNCVNDRFIQFKAQSNAFDNANSEMLGSMADDTSRTNAYERMVAAANTAHQTAEDAQGCIGVVEFDAGELEYTAPELLDDPTKGLPFEHRIEAPAYASPFV